MQSGSDRANYPFHDNYMGGIFFNNLMIQDTVAFSDRWILAQVAVVIVQSYTNMTESDHSLGLTVLF